MSIHIIDTHVDAHIDIGSHTNIQLDPNAWALLRRAREDGQMQPVSLSGEDGRSAGAALRRCTYAPHSSVAAAAN